MGAARALLALICTFLIAVGANALLQGGGIRFYDRNNTLTPYVARMKLYHAPVISKTHPDQFTMLDFTTQQAFDLVLTEKDEGFQRISQTFPGYNHSDPENYQHMFDRFRKNTKCSQYRIGVKNGEYSESASIRSRLFVDPEVTGTEATKFMHENVLQIPEFRPLLFVFEAAQRLMSPPGLFTWVLEQLYNPLYKHFTEEVHTDEKWKQTIYRHYVFNVTNDSPKRYTHTALSKLFTPIPPETDKKYSRLAHIHTPVKTVTLTVLEYKNKENHPDFMPDVDFSIKSMRFWSSPVDLRAHTAPPTQDMIIEFFSERA